MSDVRANRKSMIAVTLNEKPRRARMPVVFEYK